MRLAYQQFDLPLRHVFTISRGSTSVQPTLVVQLSVEGVHGYGEATTNSFYGATIENMSASLESVRSLVEGTLLDDPLELIAALARDLPGQEFALSALDQAIHDLWGKLRGKPVYKLWGLKTDKIPQSDYTLGIDTPEKMVAKMQEMPGWPVYKIKLGTPDDLAIVRELRQHTDADIPRRRKLRLDSRADDRVRTRAGRAGRRVHRAADRAEQRSGGPPGPRGIRAAAVRR